jgi:hypothetical protein
MSEDKMTAKEMTIDEMTLYQITNTKLIYKVNINRMSC